MQISLLNEPFMDSLVIRVIVYLLCYFKRFKSSLVGYERFNGQQELLKGEA
jgi:hypothetical protein